MSTSYSSVPSLHLLDFPEVLLYHIVSFLSGPTHRAHVICHQLAPLSHNFADTLLEGSPALWDAVLKGDYGVRSEFARNRRASKRLKQSPLQRVKDAHRLVLENTNIAYFYLEELTNSSQRCLTRSRLVQILQEYGPHLRLNGKTKMGGTFLVECCRARHVRETVVLRCVQELVDNYGASVNVSTQETAQSSLTPLCVAAARGMFSVVKYLLDAGASPSLKGTGRFRLHTNSRKSVKCSDATPRDFARALRDAECR